MGNGPQSVRNHASRDNLPTMWSVNSVKRRSSADDARGANYAYKIQIRPKKRLARGRFAHRSVSRPSSHLSRSLISFFSFFPLFFFANTGALITGCGPTATITCLAVSGSKTVSPEGLVRRRIVWIFFSLLLLNKCILYTACIQGVRGDARCRESSLSAEVSSSCVARSRFSDGDFSRTAH